MLCNKCLAKHEERLDEKVQYHQDENLRYKALIEEMKASQSLLAGGVPICDLEAELANLELTEQMLADEMLALEQEQTDRMTLLASYEEKNEALMLEEQKTLRELVLIDRRMKSCQEGNLSHAAYIRTVIHRDQVLAQSFLETAFVISLSNNDRTLGSINHFQLGCHGNTSSQWNNCNSAFFHVSLLFNALVRSLGVDMNTYEIVPFGTESFIRPRVDFAIERQNFKKDQILPLYCRGLQSRCQVEGLNGATFVLLDALDRIAKKLSQHSQDFRLPYHVSGHLLGQPASVSLRLQPDRLSEWNKALGLFLANVSACKDMATMVIASPGNASCLPPDIKKWIEELPQNWFIDTTQ